MEERSGKSTSQLVNLKQLNREQTGFRGDGGLVRCGVSFRSDQTSIMTMNLNEPARSSACAIQSALSQSQLPISLDH